MKNICPVCGYDKLFEPAYNEYGYGSYEICVCCGFQFGLDDFPDKDKGIAEWRTNWKTNGYKWHSKFTPPPIGWNPMTQIKNVEPENRDL